VPLHPWRRVTRGFNQAADLAACLDLPVVHALWRTRATAAQTGLTAAERRRNVRGAFRISPLLSARARKRMLDGQIVVLSACYTAGGAVLSGEGVLSLARSFFEAGAHAVIGSRWPLRDADAADLFDTFYQHLGRGASLAEALKATQDGARAAGRPASAWAALVLLGNGDLRPFAGANATRSQPSSLLTTAFILVIALGVVLSRRHR